MIYSCKILGVDIDFSKENIKIINSYTVTDKKQMKIILNIVKNIARKKNIFYTRNIESWIKEWKTHNLLYKFHLFKKHTSDTDLSEDESKFRLFIYDILGR